MDTEAMNEDFINDLMTVDECVAITLKEIEALLVWKPGPRDWCPRVSPGVMAYLGLE